MKKRRMRVRAQRRHAFGDGSGWTVTAGDELGRFELKVSLVICDEQMDARTGGRPRAPVGRLGSALKVLQ